MTNYVSYDQPFVSYYDTVYGQRNNPLKYWHTSEVQAAFNAAYSELGGVLARPDGPDRAVAECLLEDRIEQLGTELLRRRRAAGRIGHDFNEVHRQARRYPPELIARIKAAYDLRDVVARDIGLTGPIAGKICSPLRDDDRTPSFKVDADHFYDFGTHEHGDVIEWRMRWHHLTFWQAVESLAIQAGIPLPGEDTGGLRGLRIGRTHHA
ncbi:MAG: CHC2 zinc finger domain-containing protein [Chloroflexota bacterium]|nr:CHC2 zinc finger domain-containing protein [Chloroflexota bacterium]